MLTIKEIAKIQDAVAKYVKGEMTLDQLDYTLKSLDLGKDARRAHLFLYTLFFSLENKLYDENFTICMHNLQNMMHQKASKEYPDIEIKGLRKNGTQYLTIIDILFRHCANIYIETVLVMLAARGVKEISLVLERALNNEYPKPVSELRKDVIEFFQNREG